MIKILFFAKLREQLNCEFIELEIDQVSIAEIKSSLVKQNPQWQSVLMGNKVLAAVNQEMVNQKTIVQSGDEVAFFPPVTGG